MFMKQVTGESKDLRVDLGRNFYENYEKLIWLYTYEGEWRENSFNGKNVSKHKSQFAIQNRTFFVNEIYIGDERDF